MLRMMGRRRIGKGSLYAIADLAALSTYRAAFMHGQLGRAHAAVVREVYDLAADEFGVRRRASGQLACLWTGLVLIGMAMATLLGVNPGTWWMVELRIALVALGGIAVGRYFAYDAAARLLKPAVIDEESS